MRALVAGGGIAGPVAAIALEHAGVTVKILEAHPPKVDVGSYFTITANGLEALKTIDSLDIATESGFPTRRNVLWNHAGRRLATVPLDSQLAGSPPAHTMKRSQLARLLQEEAVRRGIRVEYGRRLTDARVTAQGGLVAKFEDGGTESGDVLVGADGVHSVVRRIIDPDAPNGRYVGLANFGGVTGGDVFDIEPETWHLIFGLRAFFGYQATPAGDVIWFANVPRPMISPDERASTTETEWRRQLVQLFADDHGPAAQLIETGELELSADNTHDLGHVPTWHRGPLVIIGDAAHAPAPTSGQGASMAIEDGIVLAQSLSEKPTIQEAFTEYERLRRDRVEKVVAYGARASSNKTPGGFGRVARDLMLPLILRLTVTEKSLAWMYDYRIGGDRPAPGQMPAA